MSDAASDASATPYSLMRRPESSTAFLEAMRCAGVLLLAIAGSALTPLPCAFSLSGVNLGTVILLMIGIANNYTTVIMIRAATMLGISGYEEVVARATGEFGEVMCQLSLVILLFGSCCCSMEVIEETSSRALLELAVETNGAFNSAWLAGTPAGQGTLLTALTVFVLLPLSLANMGELPIVSAIGVGMMVILCLYISFLASGIVEHEYNAGEVATSHRPLGLVDSAVVLGSNDAYDSDDVSLVVSRGASPVRAAPTFPALSEAASTFGYAFYIQPCALPLLRGLPDGEEGGAILERALHLTFLLTAAAYLIVGVGGLVVFGEGHVPQDLLQGFNGRVGGALSGLFCLYLCLCFPPVLVPLREVLVRLIHRTLKGADAAAQMADSSVLPPIQNAILTSALVGAALAIALLLPDASSTLFALTGATGVCAVSYIFPVLTHWGLEKERKALESLQQQQHGIPPQQQRRTSRILDWLLTRVWPALVLGVGCTASALTLYNVFRDLASKTDAGEGGGGATCNAS